MRTVHGLVQQSKFETFQYPSFYVGFKNHSCIRYLSCLHLQQSSKKRRFSHATRSNNSDNECSIIPFFAAFHGRRVPLVHLTILQLASPSCEVSNSPYHQSNHCKPTSSAVRPPDLVAQKFHSPSVNDDAAEASTIKNFETSGTPAYAQQARRTHSRVQPPTICCIDASHKAKPVSIHYVLIST